MPLFTIAIIPSVSTFSFRLLTICVLTHNNILTSFHVVSSHVFRCVTQGRSNAVLGAPTIKYGRCKTKTNPVL